MARENRSGALEAVLRRLSMVVEGVNASVIVSDEGFAIAAYPVDAATNSSDGRLNAAQLAAVSATLAALGERSLDRLAQGEMGRLLLEGEAGTLLSCPAGEVTLALLVEKDASMGHVLFAAQKTAAEIDAILARA
ncbi:MAG: roadblock/LC7 domain-containing protein [Chloroflexi bacterium]|nr:roadblock/LC7 domain-containing protein [Chloroflexota bacterium]